MRYLAAFVLLFCLAGSVEAQRPWRYQPVYPAYRPIYPAVTYPVDVPRYPYMPPVTYPVQPVPNYGYQYNYWWSW